MELNMATLYHLKFTVGEMARAVCYIHDELLLTESSRLPAVKQRASLVHSLIESYGLLEFIKVVPSAKATQDELKLFHTSDFIEYIKSADDRDSDYSDNDEEDYGLSYDCPPFKNIYDNILTIAGGSLTAASLLLNDDARIVINWNGGWHHAQRDEAGGFCYVNDIVIAIEKLKEQFRRILYIDLDIHHGNGVEDAFSFSQTVYTLSYHKYEPGFYPGTGNITDIGFGRGKGYTCNVPFREGVSDESLCYVFEQTSLKIFDAYAPDAIVVQCGSDCLNGDPLGQSNLTHDGIGKCISHILNWNKPTIFLGGGGYNLPNAARLWTYLTAIILGREKLLDMEIPDNEYFLKYGPDYRLPITKGCQKDTNDKNYLDELIQTIHNNLNYLKPTQ